MLTKKGYGYCPFNLLRKYVSVANLDLSSSLPFFRSLCFHKATFTYREIVLQAFIELGYPKNLVGLHILRARSASTAANDGVSDRLFKRHGGWKTDQAKDGYIEDKLESVLSVSKNLHV